MGIENEDLVVSGDATPPVVETPAPSETPVEAPVEAAAPKEKTSQDLLNEVVEKVRARDKKTAATTEKPEEEKPKEETPAEPVTFTPNLKFKIYNKEAKKDVEHAIPDFLKDSIKTPEQEKQLREVYEKALGIDEIKANREAIRQERDTVFQENSAIKGQIDDIRATYQRGDLESFFNKLKVPIERVLQFALEKAQYFELPPEQRQILDAKRDAELRALDTDSQNQGLSLQLQQQISDAKRYMLEATFAKSDVSSVAQEFDARAGKPGTFRQLVVDYGELAWNRSRGKIDLTPEQAVRGVMEAYGIKPGVVTPKPLEDVVATETTPGGPPAVPKKPVPVIPNIHGKSTSPLKTKPRNTEDLKKIYNEKFA